MSTYALNKKPVLRPLIEPSQYLSEDYRRLHERLWVSPSAGRIATCFGNSPAELFFSSLKRDLVHRYPFATRAEAMAVGSEIGAVTFSTGWKPLLV